jgi:hypothetical protein
MSCLRQTPTGARGRARAKAKAATVDGDKQILHIHSSDE